MGDGYVVVVYRKTISKRAQDAPARWLDGVQWGAVVVPGTAEAPFPLEALTYRRRLTCDRVNAAELTGFRDRALRRT